MRERGAGEQRGEKLRESDAGEDTMPSSSKSLSRSPLPPCPTFLLLGLDIGGTKIAGGLVDPESGRVLVREQIATRPERGGEMVLSDALALTRRLMHQAKTGGSTVAGIGIGICELVDRTGNISDEYLIRWKGLPVRKHFSQLAPTVIESDARAPAVAEARFGAGRPYRLFAYVTVGTGISYALVNDGRALTGARGNAILLASAPLQLRCEHCGETMTQVLEEYASGPALVARYNARAKSKVSSGHEVLAAVEAGDEAAVDIVQSAAAALGNSVGFMVNLLDPEAVIVGGGLGLARGLYWETFVATTRRHIYANDTQRLPIVQAELGVDAGIIGAALCAFQKDSMVRTE